MLVSWYLPGTGWDWMDWVILSFTTHLRYGDLGRLRRLTSSGAVATLVVCASRSLAWYILVRVSFHGLQLQPSVHLTALGFQSRLVGYAHLGWGQGHGPKHRKPMHTLGPRA